MKGKIKRIDPVLLRVLAENRVEELETFLTNGFDVNVKDDAGWTLLHGASCYGHPEIVILLLNKGAEADVITTTGWTPLHLAAFYGHRKIIEALLKSGGNPNRIGHKDRTPLHIATLHGNTEIVKILLSEGANPNLPDEQRTQLDAFRNCNEMPSS